VLWQSDEERERWYERGKLYWEWAAPTNDGVMSGIGPLHDTDIADSRRFLADGQTALWPGLEFRRAGRALDIGAGIGRVCSGLLLDLCGQVDLVDGSAAHLDQARASLGGEPPSPNAARGHVSSFICTDLQSFMPARASYDLIWIQWTIMYLTDSDLCRLLADCQRALAPGGLIILKDNVIDEVRGPKGLVDGRYMVDEEDASVSRTRHHLLQLVGQAGLSVIASTDADLRSEELSTCLSANGWTEMHPVVMLAMR
jgi:protein N-terminal methyltransferase